MDSHEINKVLGALLGTCLVLLSLNITAGALFSPRKRLFLQCTFDVPCAAVSDRIVLW